MLYIVDFLLPVGMLIVIHNKTGSTQPASGTLTQAGDKKKLVRMSRPPRKALAETLLAVDTC